MMNLREAISWYFANKDEADAKAPAFRTGEVRSGYRGTTSVQSRTRLCVICRQPYIGENPAYCPDCAGRSEPPRQIYTRGSYDPIVYQTYGALSYTSTASYDGASDWYAQQWKSQNPSASPWAAPEIKEKTPDERKVELEAKIAEMRAELDRLSPADSVDVLVTGRKFRKRHGEDENARCDNRSPKAE